LTRAERPNGCRRTSGEAKETGDFRPASEGPQKRIPAVDDIGRWHDSAFLMLAGIAAAGAVFFALLMRKTREAARV
jgi:hypothetical protein